MTELHLFLAIIAVLGIIATIANITAVIQRNRRLRPRANISGVIVPAVSTPLTRMAKALAPSVLLTARQLEHVNIQRKLRDRKPLNRAGFKNAIAHAWDNWEQPHERTQSEWLTYLIIYECLISGHEASHVSGVGGGGGITIDPNLPYNGQGGEFAGAGASGTWDNTAVTAGLAIAAGAPWTQGSADPLSDPNSFKGPDPSPSDSGSSYSSDSGPSGGDGS
jgi:hypothetical protein